MKKILFAVIGIVCLMTSCSKDDFTENQINPNSGKEVNFGMTIDAVTRTLYGSESTDGTKNPIYWVHGDNITIYGVDCAVGRNQADYAVSTEGVDAEGKTVINTTQNYATALNKTGDYGVQWGDKTSSDFFAVYPKVEAGAFKKNNDGSVTVRTKVNKTQNVRFEYNEAKNTWVGTHYSGTLAEGNSMTDAVMYAITPNAQSTASQVDLRFTPYSTVLRFTFEGFSVAKAAGSNEIDLTSEISINRIVLSAPNKYISGEFDMTLDNKKKVSSDISDTSKASGEIIILPNQLPLKSKQKLQFDIFTIPQEGAVMPGTKDVWAVTFETDKGNIVYNLQPLKNGEPTDAPLQIAQIHKINIPERHIVTDFEIPAKTWIRYIPRNVYLSELSMPGAWYATDSGYQTKSIAEQYAIGVRAFHIDCRLTISAGNNISDYDDPSRQYKDVESHATNESILTLACAGSETEGRNIISIPNGKMSSISKTVKQALIETINLVKENESEFIEVILSVSNKPKTVNSITGNDYIFGTVNPKMMLAAFNKVINEIATEAATKDYIYTGEITPNTTINDVLGKIVVKINMNCTEENLKTWAGTYISTNTPALFSSASMSDTATDLIALGNFSSMNSPSMFWGKNQTSSDAPMTFHYHQCQKTTGSPTVDTRKDAVWDVIKKATEVYENNKHNALFQIGIGGWTDDNDTGKRNLSATLNKLVYDIINAKLNREEYEYTKSDGTKEKAVLTPSPVGAVLMNFVNDGTTGNTQNLIDAILEMNTKFKLNRDTNKDAWPDGNPFENIGGDDNTGGGTTDPDQPEV